MGISGLGTLELGSGNLGLEFGYEVFCPPSLAKKRANEEAIKRDQASFRAHTFLGLLTEIKCNIFSCVPSQHTKIVLVLIETLNSH